MTQNEHVYVICCRLGVVGDVISGDNVKTKNGYAVLNFELATSNSFRDNQKKQNNFVKAEADIDDDSIKRKRI